MNKADYLRQVARELFNHALSAVDARLAVRDVVEFDSGQLRVKDWTVELKSRPIYVVAIGKASHAMAVGLNESLGSRIEGGVLAGPAFPISTALEAGRWQTFVGGHPLPNEQSLAAGAAAIDLLKEAEQKSGLVIYLISGGGSAMFEWPSDNRITLEDLRQANRVLVTCGATIAEINAIRQTFSAVKAGGLARLAPSADQISLIVSDTNKGDEANVASGPSIDSLLPKNIDQILDRYSLRQSLPPTVLRAIDDYGSRSTSVNQHSFGRKHQNYYVLLSNETAVNAATARARQLGFVTEVATEINEQPVDEGCHLLLSRLEQMISRSSVGDIACLVSGGEFVCPVTGKGIGGRNAETVLRGVKELSLVDESPRVILSAGTDGIDGNSPAAGAIADESSLSRAKSAGLNPESFLQNSDAYSFFKTLGDDITLGPTGTNVRDVRILLGRR